MTIVWTACAFLSGALMFSYWLGLLARHNLKHVGDGNPGALNLWRAAGYRTGLVGIILDFLKGYLVLVWILGFNLDNTRIQGYALIPVALAPIVGHAFSPFLKGKGGKAIAVTFGVWSALTKFEASLALAIILAVSVAITKLATRGKSISSSADGLQVVIGMLLLGVYLYIGGYVGAILWVWLGNVVLIAYKHRKELAFYLTKKQPKPGGE
ncbi:glycerol-3-phosphate acyltransferase [Paenibacillus sp. CGMCC 1.16610]|uniref:Glycerol-3-phosphate acyltransferase n=1 Tax=Paenibacillus anseongense TaxID=2682845 RepID=A0ABW9UFF0_9BACL|nr:MULTISPECIES: glycerol-3-phosphate acyltransferase [Paenibacillus]MBA2938394.1 glycerol-3-phosphate acyltransferase [Paenibacillus sp. CGMCC 1.16610]MVQ37453.1 glycerol-3-phosphate acyltransferase [Paenibacillus anseongense]